MYFREWAKMGVFLCAKWSDEIITNCENFKNICILILADSWICGLVIGVNWIIWKNKSGLILVDYFYFIKAPSDWGMKPYKKCNNHGEDFGVSQHSICIFYNKCKHFKKSLSDMMILYWITLLYPYYAYHTEMAGKGKNLCGDLVKR